jgi:hypothetical protein
MSNLILKLVTYGMLGSVLCAAYCYALRWNAELYCNRASLWKAALVHLLRLGFVGAGFTVCARQGAIPLLSTFWGFVGMRTIGLSRMDLPGRAEGRPSPEQPDKEGGFRKT